MWKTFLNWWYGDPFKFRGVSSERVSEVASARKAAGLKRFPNLPDNDYLNTVIDTCGKCRGPIYGGEALSFGHGGTKCAKCMGPSSLKGANERAGYGGQL